VRSLLVFISLACLQPVLALDLNAKDQNGRTPLDWTNVVRGPDPKELKETRDLLRKHGGKTGEELKAEGK